MIAKLAVDGIEAGDAEIIADEISQRVRAGLCGGVAALYPQVASPGRRGVVSSGWFTRA